MAKKTIEITLHITVRDFTAEERAEEGLEYEDCRDAAKDFDGMDLADSLVDYIVDEQDELLAGSNACVKIIGVEANA